LSRLNGRCLVKRQDATGKGRKDRVFEPVAQDVASDRIVVLNQPDANLQPVQDGSLPGGNRKVQRAAVKAYFHRATAPWRACPLA